MKLQLGVVLSLAWAGTAVAEDQSPAPALVDTVPIHPGTKAYPQELAGRGVQGTVTLRVDLSPEGRFTHPAIHESSRSEELDAAALDLVPRLKYTPSADNAASGTVLLAMEFHKDELTTLGTKTCADFNQDAAYFKEKFPERPLIDMPVFKVTGAMLAFSVKPEKRVDVFMNIKPIKARLIAECSQNPDSRFLELALKTAEAWKASPGGK